MKVALCFIISYEHILNKEHFWIDWIKPNQDIINVYFHYKDIHQITSQWVKIHTIPPQYTQKTSYYHVVSAYISLLTYAFNHDAGNSWFCMLTESCVPIISPQKFRELFFNHYQASILKFQPAYWNINIHRRANLYLLKKEYWLANDPWFTLSRNHVHKCVLFLAAKNDIYKIVNSGGLANESIFAIILQTFNELTNNAKMINESSSVADWSRMSNPTSPYLFKEGSEENINVICNLLKEHKYALFLRKVHKDFPDDTLADIMYNSDFGHTYDVLHNTVKKNNNMNYILVYRYTLFTLIGLFGLFGLYFFTSFFTKPFMDT